MIIFIRLDGLAFGKVKMTLDDVEVVVTSLFFMEGAFVILIARGRSVFALMMLLDHHISKFSGIRVCVRVIDRRSISRGIHSSLFFNNKEVDDSQWMGRELESRVCCGFSVQSTGCQK